jgi:hypothetical protein
MVASRSHFWPITVLSPRIKQESAKSTFAGSKFDVYGLKFMVERATLYFYRYLRAGIVERVSTQVVSR